MNASELACGELFFARDLLRAKLIRGNDGRRWTPCPRRDITSVQINSQKNDATEPTPEGGNSTRSGQGSATTGSAKSDTSFHGVDNHWCPPQIQSHLDGPDWC
jgi:hypothetical protein